MRIRFDVDRRPDAQTRLLTSLRRLEETEQSIGPMRDALNDLAGRVEALLPAAELVGSRLRMLFARPARRRQARAALDEIHALVTAAGIGRGDEDNHDNCGDHPDRGDHGGGNHHDRGDRSQDDRADRGDHLDRGDHDGHGRTHAHLDPGDHSDRDHHDRGDRSQDDRADRGGGGDHGGHRNGGHVRWGRLLGSAPEAVESDGEVWDDYRRRAVVYNGLLVAIAGLDGEPEAGHGHIPAEIAERIGTHGLDTSLLRVTLRGYQAFGARFALAQGRAILGDEMGLGKTVEALAAIAHLHASGATHSLVVCPASVLANWSHEIEQHSSLRPFRLHGADRRPNLQTWLRQGGVGVVTYDSLKSLAIPDQLTVALLVVDEAHYVKNPAAQRTQATRQHIQAADRVLLLTGTPMENRLDEFRHLVAHIRPDLAATMEPGAGLVGTDAFRATIADVYLRRNQADVLDELPPLIDSDEWVEPTSADRRAYARAVASGSFMAMRRAAFKAAASGESAKLRRLVEIVEEAARNGWKTVVFSSFLDVLRAVEQALGPRSVGLLTGSLDPAARQALVDELSASEEPLVLVSQIQAGGVGLNIQAASVVVLAEPQWKPSIEDQAVARLHRLGQVRPVHVHRLLTEDGVDQRMREILRAKRKVFDEYVRMSDLKDASPHAIDVAALAAAPQSQAERQIIELERRRLGLTTTSSTDTDDDGSTEPTPRRS